MAAFGIKLLIQKVSFCLNVLFFFHVFLLYFTGKVMITVDNGKQIIDNAFDVVPSKTLIYMITPTYNRISRKAELTRLAQTLKHVPRFHWILVEDGENKSALVDNLVQRLGINYHYLSAPTPNYTALGFKNPINKGVFQRNVGLEFVRELYKGKEYDQVNAVVYFGDDDNTYDVRLFDMMRNVKVYVLFFYVGVWPVALVGGVKLEKPVFDVDGRLTGFDVGFAPKRPFAVDMAGFALNLKLVLRRPEGRFQLDSLISWNEPNLFRSFNLTYDDVTPMGFNCKNEQGLLEVLVWHTKTQAVDVGQEARFRREHSNRAPDEGWEI